jgi:membrane protein DedA with SNARE-associated domain
VLLSAVAPNLPGIFKSLEPTLDHYGYLAVVGLIFLEDFGVPVPGETILITAAIYAGAGKLNVILVALLALIGAVMGDNVGFGIGRLLGREVILRWGKYVFLTEERLEKGEAFFERHGVKIIIVARFIEGLRQANGIIAGASEMPWLRFLPFNVIGAVLWVGVWVTVGELAGNHIGAVYDGITRYSLYVLIAAAVFVAGWIIRRVLKARARRAQASAAMKPELEQDNEMSD